MEGTMSTSALTESIPSGQEVSSIERETMSRIMWRLMPILMVGYFCAYLDRVNTGFAGLTMTKALSMSSTVFGLSRLRWASQRTQVLMRWRDWVLGMDDVRAVVCCCGQGAARRLGGVGQFT